ncbi:MAG: insulinase family protein [Bdellovibrionales bacterium CG10_big_fil_rev_8_21_14_0_10_45_34]|nr:MAG: insulinase family protein [Bdellovibrionales bacterium CG10_big_fil_rev_8_21_14_0_10_45_34]
MNHQIAGNDDVVFKKTVLPNGIRVVTESHSQSRASSFGVWVEVGARSEKPHQKGLSHLIEHMVFKGTEKRSAFEIARALESLGGELNAYTTREYTCFHGTTLSEDWKVCLDVLIDLVLNPKLDPVEFEREKGVVLQEISMTVDSAEEWCFDEFFRKLYRNTSLGWPILGTEDSIKNCSLDTLREYYNEHYHPRNIIVSGAGSLDHEEIVQWISELTQSWGSGPESSSNSRAVVVGQSRVSPFEISQIDFLEEQLNSPKYEQCHIVMATPSSSFKDKTRFEAFIFNSLLGGGMTSRLYQKIREEQGLVYIVYSQLMTLTDHGLCTLYAGTEVGESQKVVDGLTDELKSLVERGVTAEEVNLFKTQVRGSLLLGADDIENRMSSLAVNEMVFQEYRSVESVIDQVMNVTVDSMRDYIDQWIKPFGAAKFVVGGNPVKF